MSSINHGKAVEQSFELLIKCMLQSKHRLVELGSELNLTAMQAIILLLLDKPKPMHSFTKVFNCDASNITGLVDGLELKKLAARFPDEKDRRIKMIKLSSKGEKFRVTLLARLEKSQGSVLLKLNSKELSTLNSLLQKITTSTPQ